MGAACSITAEASNAPHIERIETAKLARQQQAASNNPRNSAGSASGTHRMTSSALSSVCSAASTAAGGGTTTTTAWGHAPRPSKLSSIPTIGSTVSMEVDAPSGFQLRRRTAVSAELSGEEESSRAERKAAVVMRFKDERKRSELQRVIQASFLLAGLSDDQKSSVIDAMTELKVQAGDVIIREGDAEADHCYVIQHGSVRVLKGGEVVQQYEDSGTFGELALMYNCPRAATVEATSDGLLWMLDREAFRSIVVSTTECEKEKRDSMISAVGIFANLTPKQQALIADTMTAESFQQGETIIYEGENLRHDSRFYVIEQGTVECIKSNKQGGHEVVKTISAGGFFGEMSLVEHIPRQAGCIAKTKVKALSLGRDAFERVMGPVQEVLDEAIRTYCSVAGEFDSDEEFMEEWTTPNKQSEP